MKSMTFFIGNKKKMKFVNKNSRQKDKGTSFKSTLIYDIFIGNKYNKIREEKTAELKLFNTLLNPYILTTDDKWPESA